MRTPLLLLSILLAASPAYSGPERATTVSAGVTGSLGVQLHATQAPNFRNNPAAMGTALAGNLTGLQQNAAGAKTAEADLAVIDGVRSASLYAYALQSEANLNEVVELLRASGAQEIGASLRSVVGPHAGKTESIAAFGKALAANGLGRTILLGLKESTTFEGAALSAGAPFDNSGASARTGDKGVVVYDNRVAVENLGTRPAAAASRLAGPGQALLRNGAVIDAGLARGTFAALQTIHKTNRAGLTELYLIAQGKQKANKIGQSHPELVSPEGVMDSRIREIVLASIVYKIAPAGNEELHDSPFLPAEKKAPAVPAAAASILQAKPNIDAAGAEVADLRSRPEESFGPLRATTSAAPSNERRSMARAFLIAAGALVGLAALAAFFAPPAAVLIGQILLVSLGILGVSAAIAFAPYFAFMALILAAGIGAIVMAGTSTLGLTGVGVVAALVAGGIFLVNYARTSISSTPAAAQAAVARLDPGLLSRLAAADSDAKTMLNDWAAASIALGRDEASLVTLAGEVQASLGSSRKLDLSRMASAARSPVDQVLQVGRGTVAEMQKAIDGAFAAAESKAAAAAKLIVPFDPLKAPVSDPTLAFPTSSKELDEMFANKEAIEKNLSEGYFKQWAMAKEISEAELLQNLMNYLAMQPHLHSQIAAIEALRHTFELSNAIDHSLALAVLQHIVWIGDEENGENAHMFTTHNQATHNFLLKYIKAHKVMKPGTTAKQRDQKKGAEDPNLMDAVKFEDPGWKTRFNKSLFLTNEMTPEEVAQLKADFRKATTPAKGDTSDYAKKYPNGRSFDDDWEINLVGGTWEALAAIVPEHDPAGWAKARPIFLMGLQNANVGSALTALLTEKILGMLETARTDEEFLQLIDAMSRVLNVGWRGNNNWKGVNDKLQAVGFADLGRVQIMRDTRPLIRTIQYLHTHKDVQLMDKRLRPALEKAMARGLNRVMESVIADDGVALYAHIRKEQLKPVELRKDGSNKLEWMAYVYSDRKLIEKYVDDLVLASVGQKGDKLEVVLRNLRNRQGMAEAFRNTRNANEAGHNALKDRIAAPVRLSMVKSAAAARLQVEKLALGKNFVDWTPELRELVKRYVGTGENDPNARLTIEFHGRRLFAKDFDSPNLKIRFTAANMPKRPGTNDKGGTGEERDAFLAFEADFLKVVGKDFSDPNAGALAEVNNRAAGYDALLAEVPPGLSEAQAAQWRSDRAEALYIDQAHAFTPVLTALLEERYVDAMSSVDEQKLELVVLNMMRRFDANKRVDEADQGWARLKQPYDIAAKPYQGVGVEQIAEDAKVVAAILDIVLQNADQFNLPGGPERLKSLISGKLLAAARRMTDTAHLPKVLERGRVPENFTMAAAAKAAQEKGVAPAAAPKAAANAGAKSDDTMARGLQGAAEFAKFPDTNPNRDHVAAVAKAANAAGAGLMENLVNMPEARSRRGKVDYGALEGGLLIQLSQGPALKDAVQLDVTDISRQATADQMKKVLEAMAAAIHDASGLTVGIDVAHRVLLVPTSGRDAAALGRAVAAAVAAAKAAPAKTSPGQSPGAQVEVASVDITKLPADGLITAINSRQEWYGKLDEVIQGLAGQSFHDQARAATPLTDGRTVVAKGSARNKAAFKNVVFVVDDWKRPLREIVLSALQGAEKAGFATVSLPTIRMGKAIGVYERTPAQAVAEIVAGVKAFQASNPSHVKKITLVVYNDKATEAGLRSGLAAQ